MSYTVAEMEKAVDTISERTNLKLSHELACSIADKIVDKLERMSFIEARRFALNETMSRRHYKNYSDYRKARLAYNSVMGKVFGDHANKKRAKKKEREEARAAEKAKEIAARANPPRSGPIILEGKKGQLKFLV